MSAIALLFICLIIGVLLQKLKQFPNNAHIALNMIILNVSLPAVCILTLPHLNWNLDLLSVILVGWIIFGCAFFFFRFLGKINNWDSKLVGCLILCGGLGNTSFVGFPVIEALFGKEALKNAVLLDQAGSFFIVSTLGIWLASVYSAGKIRKRDLAFKVVTFGPFIGFVLGTTLGFFNWEAEGGIKYILERLAGTLTPLALISVGLQLKWGEIKHEVKFLSIGLGYKLILAPMVIFGIYSFLHLPTELFKVIMMESAMAPMITASILASSHGLHPRLAGMMIGVGVPISFFTLTCWYFLI
jgi:predicted permease